MIGFSAQRCKKLCDQIARGNNVACCELFEYIGLDAITPTAHRLLAKNIDRLAKSVQGVSPVPAWLLFLQGIESIYERGFTHPRTFELLTAAYEAGQTSAGTLLVLYYGASDLKKYVGRGEAGTAKRFRFMERVQKRDRLHQDTKKSNDLLAEVLAKGDIAAMLLSACTLAENNLKNLKNNTSSVLDETRFEDTELENYRKVYQWLNYAVAAGSIEARYRRALIFIKYRQNTGKKYFLLDYGKEEAIRDLDVVIATGHIDAMRWRAQLAGGTSDPHFPDVKKDKELVARLMRKVYQLNVDELKAQRVRDEKVIEEIWRREVYEQGNNSNYWNYCDLRIQYYYWMSKNIYNIKYLYYELPLQDKRLTKLLQTMMQDDMVPEKQKFYLLQDLVKHYAKQLQESADTALPEHYVLFQQALLIMEGISPDDKGFEFIIEHYEKIPLTTVAGMRAQMQMANLYFDELLNTTNGKERNALIDMIQSCHTNVESAYNAVIKDCPNAETSAQNEWENIYKKLIEKRKSSPVFVKSTIVETVKKGLFWRMVEWFTGLFVSAKASKVKTEPAIVVNQVCVDAPIKYKPAPAGVFVESQPIVVRFIFSNKPHQLAPAITESSKNPLDRIQLKV